LEGIKSMPIVAEARAVYVQWMGTIETEILIAEIAVRTEAAIELVLLRVEKESNDWRRAAYRNLANNLASYKAALLEGRLCTPGAGLGWGAGKAISEWGLDDSEMSAAVELAEGLYRDGR
jgi:hypothetical protein